MSASSLGLAKLMLYDEKLKYLVAVFGLGLGLGEIYIPKVLNFSPKRFRITGHGRTLVQILCRPSRAKWSGKSLWSLIAYLLFGRGCGTPPSKARVLESL